ncbi:UTRA domain-containing protein (plasmid) [Pseudorhodobacter turbinis]|uniref:UTRA domain-containing protein n=1 Tax=Pseudorhodobacter turbinis TaxID=2500533 RepID=A0A4P8EJB1_9RHOB|nr:UTRA domain-containing protein [Pseudorhodobacter turbinis]QCO57049.1 UTRA domain-containing protein [Pseudorhodobacter turbinis]
MTSTTWQSVQAEALRRIRSREWPPGGQIPHEADLAEELGCSRGTVNRALRDLAEAGLLERRRKAGTRVPLNPVRKATLEIPIIRQDVEGRGQTYGYRLLATREAAPPPEICERLSLKPDTAMIHVLALHLADDLPFCLEDRWINLRVVPEIAQTDLTKISANEWLVQNAAFSAGSFAFGAIAAPEATAKWLDCPIGAPLFTLDRTTWAAALPITSVRLCYIPGYQMRAEI